MLFNQILSYKQLCKELSIEYKTNKARELQIQKLQETYHIEKVANQRGKYIVYRELSSEEKQFIQDTKNYTTYITNILLNLFAENSESSCTYTFREIREKIGMVNSKYFPVKYHKEKIEIPLPINFSGNAITSQREWFNISDSMDEAIIKYSLDKLKKKGLIEYYQTYKFYKIIPQTTEQNIFYPPHVLNEEELSDFLQAQVEALHNVNLGSKQQLFTASDQAVATYYRLMNEYVQSKGYTNYARAITIIKPKELHKFTDFFLEPFNKLQVQKYLKSKRFKTIPPFIHENLIKQLISLQ